MALSDGFRAVPIRRGLDRDFYARSVTVTRVRRLTAPPMEACCLSCPTLDEAPKTVVGN